MKRINLHPNPERDPTLERTARVLKHLSEFTGEICLLEDYKDAPALVPYLSRIRFVSMDELFKGDLLITLGGDGTILSKAPRAAEAGIPIFGINFGNVGFMTSLEEKEIEKLVDLIRGDYTVSSRMLLECSVGKKKF